MQTSPQQPVITLSGLNKAFEGIPVINEIDLTLARGEFITLLGPSGCGKTTLLRLIAGLETPDQGIILLNGQDITALPAEQRNINTVFQNYALFPHMNVSENVAFSLRMQHRPAAEIKQRVEAVLALVQLSDFATRRPSQLSGGQQQRVAIARAIISNPSVLLLDEPLAALDYHLRKQMQLELKTLQHSLGITFIFVTHDQQEALALSDRIVVMKDGQVCQTGTPQQIYQQPDSLFVARFIGEINQFNARALSATGEGDIRVSIGDYHCQADCRFSVSPGDVLQILVRPEDLRIAVAGDTAGNGLHGFIRERNYQGSTLQTVVDLHNGQSVTACEFIHDTLQGSQLSAGQPVTVSWSALRARTLPATASE